MCRNGRHVIADSYVPVPVVVRVRQFGSVGSGPVGSQLTFDGKDAPAVVHEYAILSGPVATIGHQDVGITISVNISAGDRSSSLSLGTENEPAAGLHFKLLGGAGKGKQAAEGK